MKALYAGISVFLLIAAFSIPSFGEKGEKDGDSRNPYIKTYPFKSAVIKYTGKTEYGYGHVEEAYTGTEAVYIKEGRLAKETKLKELDEEETTQVETLQIIDPEYAYVIDITEKSGVKVDNPWKYGKVEYEKLTETEKVTFRKRMDERGIVSLDLLDIGKKIGTEKVLGRECDVYQTGERFNDEDIAAAMKNGEPLADFKKIWVWKDAMIPLKVVTLSMDSSSEFTATAIEENVDIPDKIFEIPSGMKVEFDEYQSETAKIDTLNKFHLYKTGKYKPMRVKAQKEVITPEGEWVPADSPEGKKILETVKPKPGADKSGAAESK
jgi:hypothetical protein